MGSKLTKKRIIIIAVILLVFLLLAIIIVNLYAEGKRKEQEGTTTTTTKFEYTGLEEIDDEEVIFTAPPEAQVNKIDTQINLEEATEEERKAFKISDLDSKTRDKATIISGKIKSTLDKSQDVVVAVDYYKDKKVVGSSSITIKDLEKNKSQNFEISTMSDLATDDYKVYVKYIEK